MIITLGRFPTHIQTSKYKFKKINGNLIWATTNHFIRAKIKEQISSFIIPFLPEIVFPYPVEIEMEFHVPWNYNTVQMRKGRIIWKNETNFPNNQKWDVGNYGMVWDKAFLDCIVEKGLLPDDSVTYIRSSGKVTFFPVNSLEERKIVFIIKKYK